MHSMRFVVLLVPLALFLLWLGIGAALGRKPSRATVTTSFSLLLLLYFLVVVGTGIFWVAAQELPVFDWHYLPGYILLAMTLAHVVLHWRNVTALLRRGAPGAALEPGGARFRPVVRGTGYALAVAAVGALVFFLGVRQGSRSLTFVVQEARGGSPRESAAKPLVPPVLVNSGGTSTTLAEFYHEGSSYPARASLPGLTLSARPEVYKEYPGKAEVALPPAASEGGGGVAEDYQAWIGGTARPGAVALTLEQLSMLLFHTQGVDKTLRVRNMQFDLRAAPSAGALYPVNVYVLVSEVKGVEPGLYYYHPKRASLVQVKSDPDLVYDLQALSGSPGLLQGAPAAAIFSVTFGRTAFKYKERAYRYVAMDTGHAAYNLGVCASSIGLRAPMIGRFDDRALNAFLGVDPAVEAGFLIMPIGAPKGDSAEPSFKGDVPAGKAPAKASFVELVHGGTCLRFTGGSGKLPRHPSHLEGGSKDIPLPAPAHGNPLLAAIRARRSVRDYTADPIGLDELSTLCAASARVEEGSGLADPLLASSAPLTLYAVVHRVTGLDQGVYRYVPSTHALQLVKKGDFSAACMEACLEQEFCGTAAVVFVKTVRWSDLLYPDGDRGYRYANLRAGVIGEGIYLAGTALGIGVCGVGAFMDPSVAALLDLDPSVEAPLYVTAAGRAAKVTAAKPAAAAVNLDFEQGEKGQVPAGWLIPKGSADRGYKAVLTDERPYQGRLCASLSGEGKTFGALTQRFDAVPYRGKRVRFKAAVRTDVAGADNWVGLWMRVDLKDGGTGFFDNMQDRPITSRDWNVHQVEGDVDGDAEAISIGLLLSGSGKAWVDAASVEVVGSAKPPKP